MKDSGAEKIAEFTGLYLKQQDRHMESLLYALELLHDSIQKGFSDVEEQLENIGDALRDLESTTTTTNGPDCDSIRLDQGERADNRS